MVSDAGWRKPQQTTYLLRRNMTTFRYNLQYLPGFFADSFADRIAVSAITGILLNLTIFADFR